MLLAALVLSSEAVVEADVYYYVDSDGVFHFTSSRVPGSLPFAVNDARVERSTSPGRGDRGGEFDHIILEYADRYDVEPALVKAVIHAESGFNRFAVSRKGARGLMQLMPVTARSYGARNPLDARQNIRAGVKHLRHLLDRFRNNYRLAVAAYNAGATSVQRHRGLPPYPETRLYVTRVLKLRQQYLSEASLAQASSRT